MFKNRLQSASYTDTSPYRDNWAQMTGAGVTAAQVPTVASEMINIGVDIALFPSKREGFLDDSINQFIDL